MTDLFNEYADLEEKKLKFNLSKLLKEVIISKTDGLNNFILKFKTGLNVMQFNADKKEIEYFIHSKVPKIQIEFKLEFEETLEDMKEKMPVLPLEIYKRMAEKNPVLKELYQKFNLIIE